MRPWKVTVVDGQYRRYAGFGVVMAGSENAARSAMAEYLNNDHAYGKSYQISAVEQHDSAEPYVAFFNWGEVPRSWPSFHETADPDVS